MSLRALRRRSSTGRRTSVRGRSSDRPSTTSRRTRSASTSRRSSASAFPNRRSSPGRRWTCPWCSSSIPRSRRTPTRKTSTKSRSATHFIRWKRSPPLARAGATNEGISQQMSAAKNHDYHLVNPSPWPLFGAISAGFLFSGAVMWFHANRYGVPLMFVGIAGVLATMYLWWHDVIHEAHTGDHTPVVQLHLRYGMILFIASEVMFFVGWFWAWFDFSLFPDRNSTR